MVEEETDVRRALARTLCALLALTAALIVATYTWAWLLSETSSPSMSVGFTWYCDAGALLYPDGPNSTPICVAYTPARKL